MDHAADVPAPPEDRAGGERVYREAGKHEFALTAAELGVVGTLVVGGRLRESLDHWHIRAFPSMGLADPTVPSGREPTAAWGFPGGEVTDVERASSALRFELRQLVEEQDPVMRQCS